MYLIFGIISTLLMLSLVHANFEFERCSGRDVARVRQDPHLDLSKGGRADFRGEDGALYNYLSTPGLSVNVRIEEALYTLHDGKLLVNGTFMTEVHVSALVAGDRLCKWGYVSYVARELNGHPPSPSPAPKNNLLPALLRISLPSHARPINLPISPRPAHRLAHRSELGLEQC